jgi:hypothetical protein
VPRPARGVVANIWRDSLEIEAQPCPHSTFG